MTLKVVITDIVERTTQIKSFVLKLADGGSLPRFKAGAHINVSVILEDGTKSSRAYSLCDPEGESETYEISVLLQGELGGSAYMHRKLHVGDILEISRPVNNFGLVGHEGTEHILIAGGIGVTPMLSMARTLSSTSALSHFHYFGRSEDSMAFLGNLRELPLNSLELYIGRNREETGAHINALLLAPSSLRHLYVCGPLGMIQSVVDQADARGWNPENVHFEQFSSGVVGLHNADFTVNLTLSGRTVEVRSDQTLLDALLEHGVDAYYDCRSGICGSCLVPMTGGIADHRDTFLNDVEKQENSLICTCVSRASPGSTLDLDI